jgi:hypothetical protein
MHRQQRDFAAEHASTIHQPGAQTVTRMRLLLGVAAVLGALSLATGPATAKFVGSKGQTSGKISMSGMMIETPGLIGCWLSKSEWKIRDSKGENPTKEGTLLNVSGQWGCSLFWQEIVTPMTVNPSCELQFRQINSKTGSMRISSTCTLTAGAGCNITLPTKANENLTKVELLNSGSKLEVNTELGSVTSQLKEPECEGLVINGNGKQTIMNVKLLADELKIT